jgi:hypothetical protein
MTLTELKYIVAEIPGAKGEGPRVRGSTRGRDRRNGARWSQWVGCQA